MFDLLTVSPKIRLKSVDFWDQYLGNWPPTPPLTEQQSIDNKLGLRGRWAVAQILILIQFLYTYLTWLILNVAFFVIVKKSRNERLANIHIFIFAC